ncbi:hypothetical protein ACF05L_24755, partial [Streptomyces bobili]|uniref:hypothetical protein n=1 Tax=Streptomyces bobili TaxID=67280 RepID=UPI0036FD51BB
RTRKTATTAPAAEVAVDTAEGTVVKPRRTRKTATTVVEAGAADEAKPKARRPRKATAAAESAES